MIWRMSNPRVFLAVVSAAVVSLETLRVFPISPAQNRLAPHFSGFSIVFRPLPLLYAFWPISSI